MAVQGQPSFSAKLIVGTVTSGFALGLSSTWMHRCVFYGPGCVEIST